MAMLLKSRAKLVHGVANEIKSSFHVNVDEFEHMKQPNSLLEYHNLHGAVMTRWSCKKTENSLKQIVILNI